MGWGIADQAVSSVTNFVLVVLVARSVGARSFGVFSLAFGVYALALGACRAVVGEPMGIRHSASSADAGRRAVSDGAGAALTLGAAGGLALLAPAIALGGGDGMVMAALAVSLPGLLLQDAWRYGFVAIGRARQALVNDVVWAVAQLGAIAWLLARGERHVAALILAWGAAAAAAAAVGCVQARALPVPGHTRRWLRRHRDLWPRLGVEFFAMTGTWQLVMVCLGAVAGLAAVGSLRAAQTLLGPLNLAFLALPMVAVPELARLHARRPGSVVRGSAAIGGGLALLAVAGGALGWFIPDGLGRQLFGVTWAPARAVLLPVTAFLASTGVNIGAIIGLRATGAAARSMRVRLLTAPLLLVAGTTGAVVAGAGGAATGLALANWTAAAVWWWQLTRVTNRRTDMMAEKRNRVIAGVRALARRTRVSRGGEAVRRSLAATDGLIRRLPWPPPVKRRMARLRLRPGVAVVEMDRFLLGGENGLSAAEYAEAVGELLRPSTPIARWPHVLLLQAHQDRGDSLFEPEVFAATPYSRNARRCIVATGHYFGATTDEEVRQVAADFVRRHAGDATAASRPSQSRLGEPIRVRPVRRSTCFEVVDGHHRLAARFVAGETAAAVAVERRQVSTPLQTLLGQMSWLEGKPELYQPLESPELADGFVQVRKCRDRMAKIRDFLGERALIEGPATYLDVASCYGWFVAQMEDLGFDAHGMERDPLGAVLAQEAYGVPSGKIAVGDCVELLEASESTYDVVSCFSLLHHFVLGRGSCSAERLIELVDRATGRVLFFDTGQGTEAWFRDSLPGWDADFIEGWLREHTSFDEIVRLGRDEDAVAPFADNYGRMLFACVRVDVSPSGPARR